MLMTRYAIYRQEKYGTIMPMNELPVFDNDML